VDITPLAIAGAYKIDNQVHADERGEFVEWFRADLIAKELGLVFDTVQANLSVSSKGSLRGVHFADVPPGQAKYVMCATGSIRDYVVDVRVGSPTFGQSEFVTITAKRRNGVLLDVGLGHAFVALESDTTVVYLVTDHFKPSAEHAVNPFDEQLSLDFPTEVGSLLASDKDQAAPSLQDALVTGLLPRWQGA
jgi:dTDP-4-dehydrorhamnose 3,5-epimerase